MPSSRSGALLALSLPLLLSATLLPSSARADDDGSALHGKFSHTLIQTEGIFTTTTKITIDGVWKLAKSDNACVEGSRVGRGAMHYRGFDGTLSWEQIFEDKTPLPEKPWTEEVEADLRKWVKRRVRSYSRRITIPPDRHAQGLWTTATNPVAALGCIHLDPTAKKMVLEKGFFNSGNNSVLDEAITTTQVSMLGNPVPWQRGSAYYLYSGEPLEHLYNPDAATVAGSKNWEEPPQPGVSPEEFHHEHRWTWNLSHRPRPETITVKGNHCGCNKDQEVTIDARAATKGTAGVFEAFEVDGPFPKPTIVQNDGGRSAMLVLKGDPKQTNGVKVTAVFRNGNQVIKSPPHEVSFLLMEPVTQAQSPHRIGPADYLFDEGTPGKLEIPFEKKGAWKDGQPADDEVTWDISNNGSGKLKQQKTGNTVKFVANGLFDTNGEFGERTVTAALEVKDCRCEADEKKVRLFYISEAKNNPNNKLQSMPNWAFYWAQTKAGQRLGTSDRVQFVYRDTIPPPIIGDPPEGQEFGRYEPVNDTLYVSQLANGTCCPPASGGAKNEGIDCFAVTVNHESRHREQLTEWWGPQLSRYPCFKDPHCLNDKDNDRVPDNVEVAAGCGVKAVPVIKSPVPTCPRMPHHCGKMTDLEMDAYEHGWRWPTGTADKEDWGCPGKQCKQKP
ncbi:MAG TPA: hypothetical protein VK447_04130 [Myxococcaceae bacterium]|nr:hypothetical protein [Myxococcaceae bacterium]